jgi:hypothetical protein
MGLPANKSRMTTRNAAQWLAARGFRPGYKGPGAINIGWYNHGPNTQDGHMAITLPDGVHAEMGGSHGSFLLGPGAAGAESSEFDHHMYLPIAGFVGEPSSVSGGASPYAGSPQAGGSSVSSLTGGSGRLGRGSDSGRLRRLWAGQVTRGRTTTRSMRCRAGSRCPIWRSSPRCSC